MAAWVRLRARARHDDAMRAATSRGRRGNGRIRRMKPVTPLVICLVGFPGVGKLTIAQNLARSTNATVVDNHWIYDPILRLVARDNLTPVPDAAWPLVAQVRGAVLEAIATLAPNDRSFIFTYAGSDEDPADRKAFDEYREVANRRGAH